MKHITTSIITFCSLAALLLPGCKKECTSGQNFVVQAPMRVEPQATEIRLGDTLTITIEVPYNNIDLKKNIPVNVGGYNVSEFGLEFILFNAVDNKLVGEGIEQFTLIPQKGGGRLVNSRLRNVFAAESNRYIYQAKLIPHKKGMVHIASYRAEARDGCTLVDFSPTCINNPNNYDMYYQWGTGIVGPSEYFNNQRHYYIWVR
jgi:hypothetical protein